MLLIGNLSLVQCVSHLAVVAEQMAQNRRENSLQIRLWRRWSANPPGDLQVTAASRGSARRADLLLRERGNNLVVVDVLHLADGDWRSETKRK